MFTTKFKKLGGLVKSYRIGFITGASDNDPAGITTYAVAGAQTGFSQLWLFWLMTPLLINIQAMCARISDVTKKGLATVVEDHYGRKIAIFSMVILVVCNILTIGANLAGMAAVLNLITGVNLIVFVPFIVLFLWFILLFESYKNMVRYFSLFALFLLAYIAAGFLAKPDWFLVIKSTFVPQIKFNSIFLAAMVGMLGTTIAPYLFFWQASEELEEHHYITQARKSFRNNIFGFVFSNIIAYFIVLTTAATLFGSGSTIASAHEAAEALRPIAGDLSYLLFSVGILGAGMMAIPVLVASTGYVVAETLRWREGLSQKIHKAKGFYGVLTITFLIGMIIAVSGVNPISALFYSQVLNGILAPILLVLIIKIANNHQVMGEFKNRVSANFLGWTTVGVMALAATAMFISFK